MYLLGLQVGRAFGLFFEGPCKVLWSKFLAMSALVMDSKSNLIVYININT
jgi:hypothetical protein